MSAQNVAPIIIKRKKVSGGDGHHGGAWKVAYADFVTAMMAFFLLMWLLNATTEKQRKGIADHFSPTIPINRISGGGDGAFGGTNVFSETVLAKNGTGSSSNKPTESNQARGQVGGSEGQTTDQKEQDTEELLKIEEALMGVGGESMISEKARRHIVTRLTDEGLIVELFELEGEPLFQPGTDIPLPLLDELATVIADLFQLVKNDIAFVGHTRSRPVVFLKNPVWDLSTQRADRMRRMLEGEGILQRRIQRVTGHADRKLYALNPMAMRNNRIEVILLRSDI
jgi:chemotaxis protein MotB